MLPFLNIGPFAIPSKPFVTLIGIYLALFLLERHAAKENDDPAQLYTIGTNSVIAGFIGARALFVAQNWAGFQNNLLGIVWPITTGYHLIFGISTFFLALYLLALRHDRPLLPLLARFTPFFLSMLATFSLADWLGGPGFGSPTSILGLTSHPIWLYELSTFGLASLFFYFGREHSRRPAFRFLMTTAIVAGGLLLVIPFRGNSWILAGRWYGWQLVALVVLSAALSTLTYLTPAEKSD